jgi:hypothetical protein
MGTGIMDQYFDVIIFLLQITKKKSWYIMAYGQKSYTNTCLAKYH